MHSDQCCHFCQQSHCPENTTESVLCATIHAHTITRHCGILWIMSYPFPFSSHHSDSSLPWFKDLIPLLGKFRSIFSGKSVTWTSCFEYWLRNLRTKIVNKFVYTITSQKASITINEIFEI